MSLFGFDQQYAMFDVTPLENQFILEYLPAAKGDYVRVYLYGLMQCYHPRVNMSVETMAKELGMTQEEVMAAYRHWERNRLVERISDDPPSWRYMSLQALMASGQTMVDTEYAAFAEQVYTLLGEDRKVTPREISMAYEWVTDMNLPAPVVLALLENCKQTRGKKFSFKTAEKLATQLAEEKAATP